MTPAAHLTAARALDVPSDRIDRRAYRMSEQLAAMINAGEFDECTEYAMRDLERLQLALLDLAADAFVQCRPRVPLWRRVFRGYGRGRVRA